MTTRQMVAELQRKGHTVTYYIRKDGGILIRSIDGQRYKGASGNAVARTMLGVELSEARARQTKYAQRQQRRKRTALPDAIKEEYQRVKKIWNKAFRAKGGKPSTVGYFGRSAIEYTYRTQGAEETLRRIHEAEKYATGMAYSKNIEHLSSFIRDAGEKYRSKALIKLADDIITYGYTIKDEWIYPAYQELYKLNVGIAPATVAKNTRRILRLNKINED